MKIYVLSSKPTEEQTADMLAPHGDFIKLAVDVRRHVAAGGGEMHADCEEALLEGESAQDDVWGADWIPATRTVRYTSFINIRPRLGNRQMEIGDPDLRQRVEHVVRSIFE